MNHKQTRLKELQQLMEDAKTFYELTPIAEELKKEKYRFTKAKEKYKAEHEGELRRFYMVKRKLKENGFEKGPFPLNAWQKEFSELSAQREYEYQQYKHQLCYRVGFYGQGQRILELRLLSQQVLDRSPWRQAEHRSA